ncbi:hypothetical protein IWX47DRAFT_92279 [Phyllosticta citricarpa]
MTPTSRPFLARRGVQPISVCQRLVRGRLLLSRNTLTLCAFHPSHDLDYMTTSRCSPAFAALSGPPPFSSIPTPSLPPTRLPTPPSAPHEKLPPKQQHHPGWFPTFIIIIIFFFFVFFSCLLPAAQLLHSTSKQPRPRRNPVWPALLCSTLLSLPTPSQQEICATKAGMAGCVNGMITCVGAWVVGLLTCNCHVGGWMVQRAGGRAGWDKRCQHRGRERERRHVIQQKATNKRTDEYSSN